MDSLLAQVAHPLNLAKRSKRKTLILMAVGAWLAFVNYWLYFYRSGGDLYQEQTSSIYFDEQRPEPDLSPAGKPQLNADSLAHHLLFQLLRQQQGSAEERPYDSHSTVYNKIFADHDVDSVLANLDFHERCDLYFLNLYADNPNWKVDPNEDLPVPLKDEYTWERFRLRVIGDVKEEIAKEKEIEKDAVPEDDALEERIKKKFREMWAITLKTEQKAADMVSHVRVFNKCFISGDELQQQTRTNQVVARQKRLFHNVHKTASSGPSLFVPLPDEARVDTASFDSCSQLQLRVYPWLSGLYPVYERWDGKTLMRPPVMSRYVNDKKVHLPTDPKAKASRKGGVKFHSGLTGGKLCFLNEFKNAINAKGIILSIGDQHGDDTVRLIHLLRALGNTYPIQIVYNDNISRKTKTKIVNAARSQDVTLPLSFFKVSHYFKDDFLAKGKLPPQEVWFVNTHNVIQDSYKNKFHGFGNKFLAALFNSFEEYMLVDADTILVQNPDFYFRMKGYVNKGALFFKDRTAPWFREVSDGVFFRKISPSVIDSAMFDIPLITNHTVGRPYFDGMLHYMESGLVLVDRNRHFNSVVMMLQMNFMGPVTSRSYGDKEVIWLSFATNGDEGYHFNKYYGAAVGTLTPETDRLSLDGHVKISKEICSAHPGHISEEDDLLLWFNLGFHTCGQLGKVDYEKEAERQERFKLLKTADQFRAFYEQPLVITHAVIPPFKNKLETLCENTIDEPKEGWLMDYNYCHSYLWCAYLRIGGPTKDNTDNTQKGKVFTFKQKSTELLQFYGDVWVGTE